MASGQEAKGKASMQWACNKGQREKLTATRQRAQVVGHTRPVSRRQQTAGSTVETCLCSSDAWRHVVRCFLEEWVIQQLSTGWPLGRVSLYTCLQRHRKPGITHEDSKAARVVDEATSSGRHALLQLHTGMSRLHACRLASSRSSCRHYI